MRARTAREVGLLVRERRHDLRLSQAELAARAGPALVNAARKLTPYRRLKIDPLAVG